MLKLFQTLNSMRIGFLSARDDVEGDLETVHKIEFPETRDFTLKKKKKIVGVSRKFKNQRSNLDLIFLSSIIRPRS